MWGDPPIMEEWELRGIVAEVLRDAGGTDIASLCSWLRMRVIVTADAGLGGTVVSEVVAVPPAESLERLYLAVRHELAHEILRRDGRRHSHGDVWALTALLGSRA